ncbi:MAG: Serine/threonine protein kinase [Candidatus Eremiobacteraeota bacterium]|nr:Serine/threonine protein kinase [Candidatus Eremiobacteraeota bacterium]
MENDPLLGRVIDGKYRVDAEIGAGGMATIYRATRLHIGDVVAIKVLHSELLRDPQFADRFRREAQAAARLKHPNVVAIYDFGVSTDGVIYLVMELIEGRNLRAVIRDQGPLPAALAAEIIRQVCAALTAADRQHIVHRDLKPANIAVEDSLDGPRVKLLDFGIASLRGGGTVANLTQTGTLLGTPAYMSPEQCLGEEIDARSDIYSLGVVLFEMLCGVVPFNSPTATAVVMQHVQQPPPALRVLNASVSPAVEAVVLRALAKQREDRFQSARELGEALTAATSGPRLSMGAETVATPRFSVPAFDATTVQRAWPAPLAPRAPAEAHGGRASGIIIGLVAALVLVSVLFGFQRLLSTREAPRATAQIVSAESTAPARTAAQHDEPAVRQPQLRSSTPDSSVSRMLYETRELDVLGSAGCAADALMIRFKDDGTSACARMSATRGTLESGINVVLVPATSAGRGRIFDLLYTDSGARTRFVGILPGDGSGGLTVSLENGYIVERNGPRVKRSTMRAGRVVPVSITSVTAPESADAVVRAYYGLWDAQRLPEAYALLSTRYQSAHPYAPWAASHRSVVHISVATGSTSDPMAVAVVVQSIDRTPYGTSTTEYQGTWRAVSEDGATRLDQVALERTQ